mmetsp:Transcript_29749/g.45995  ORF Transcript_29749/g.45995 Transcript_29749/m.45995 type:complete len:87 (+) Transcript_29749:50-310(+)
MVFFDSDLAYPSERTEAQKHKRRRLLQGPNSFFWDVKCKGCYQIQTVYSHAKNNVICPGCNTLLARPTGGKARLSEGIKYRRKPDY